LSGVPNVASVSGLSIFDCPFGFLQRLLKKIWPVKICSSTQKIRKMNNTDPTKKKLAMDIFVPSKNVSTNIFNVLIVSYYGVEKNMASENMFINKCLE
jgi:hypothetical protein